MSILEALENWQGIVGSENIITEQSQLLDAETATFLTQQKIKAILLAEVIDVPTGAKKMLHQNR